MAYLLLLTCFSNSPTVCSTHLQQTFPSMMMCMVGQIPEAAKYSGNHANKRVARMTCTDDPEAVRQLVGEEA